MTFAPVVPLGGLAGLRFVERTFDRQFETFLKSPEIQREIDHFLANAGAVETAADLVADRRLLGVALGAFGLDNQVQSRAFVRKVLEDGTLAPNALANRLANPAWQEFSRTLGFGDVGGLLGVETVREEVVERFRIRQFERAVGEQNLEVRLALNFKREVAEIAADPNVARFGWLRILGSQPLRQVIEGALGLPSEFGAVDLDQQISEIERRSRQLFGGESPAVFADPEVLDDALRRFLVRVQAASGPDLATPGAAALTVLRANALGAGATTNLILSNL